VWNVSRLWAYQPDTVPRLFEPMSQAFKPSGLGFRQRGILVTAAVSVGCWPRGPSGGASATPTARWPEVASFPASPARPWPPAS
jgi:hypothetical protein